MRGTRPLLSVFAHCKPDKNGCWIWQLARQRSGHGVCSVGGGKSGRAHRQAWIEKNGPVPEGMCVLHKCDNPPCINPEHLWLGTQLQNIQDMLAKRRHRYGERHRWTKFADADIKFIRASTLSSAELSEKVGASQDYICEIRRGSKRKYT